MSGGLRRWPLLLLALPAAVATWSGWVGLGEKTGFGVVKPLPGISDIEINTAICLPIGVEAYAAFALSAWLSSAERVGDQTRAFAKWSAIGSLLLGMLGQVAYHLLETAGYNTAPVWVTTAVSCLPVLVLGMGAALGHMLARDVRAATPAAADEASGTPAVEDDDAEQARYDRPEQPESTEENEQASGVPALSAGVPEDEELQLKAASHYFIDLANGEVPAVRTIKTDLGVGTDKARAVRLYLAGLAGA